MISAREKGILIPAFNAAYPPMMAPMVRAAADTGAFVLMEVARVEWEKFGAVSIDAIHAEYQKCRDDGHVRLHLDHVPVIDEDGLDVDYREIIRGALKLGYHSVMVDGSRLDLEGNIAATREIADMAHAEGVAVEAELGAVMGHEAGPMPPYEELFATRRGFTDVDDARRFAAESGCDWLSVAVGSIHGAVSGAAASEKKVRARIDQDHLKTLNDALGIPLVLHGGSGIDLNHVREAASRGICKMNIGTELRQLWEKTLAGAGQSAAEEALYRRTRVIIAEELIVSDSARRLLDS